MMKQANARALKKMGRKYLEQQVRTASKEKLIAMLYEIGLASCNGKDRQKASAVLTELIASLNFEYEEMALSFFNIYRYALDQVHMNRFDQAASIFRELNTSWKASVLKASG